MPGERRSPDHGAQRHAGAPPPAQAMPEPRLQRPDLVEEPRREARALGMVDQTPQCALIRLEPYGQLIELFMETVRVERAGSAR